MLFQAQARAAQDPDTHSDNESVFDTSGTEVQCTCTCTLINIYMHLLIVTVLNKHTCSLSVADLTFSFNMK